MSTTTTKCSEVCANRRPVAYSMCAECWNKSKRCVNFATCAGYTIYKYNVFGERYELCKKCWTAQKSANLKECANFTNCQGYTSYKTTNGGGGLCRQCWEDVKTRCPNFKECGGRRELIVSLTKNISGRKFHKLCRGCWQSSTLDQGAASSVMPY
jgi:hypothetical protein